MERRDDLLREPPPAGMGEDDPDPTAFSPLLRRDQAVDRR
jgi:hypothetical protein